MQLDWVHHDAKTDIFEEASQTNIRKLIEIDAQFHNVLPLPRNPKTIAPFIGKPTIEREAELSRHEAEFVRRIKVKKAPPFQGVNDSLQRTLPVFYVLEHGVCHDYIVSLLPNIGILNIAKSYVWLDTVFLAEIFREFDKCGADFEPITGNSISLAKDRKPSDAGTYFEKPGTLIDVYKTPNQPHFSSEPIFAVFESHMPMFLEVSFDIRQCLLTDLHRFLSSTKR